MEDYEKLIAEARGWDADGVNRHAASALDTLNRLADALEAVKAGTTTRVEYGVRIGTWPDPHKYQDREMAEWHAARPAWLNDYPHVVVTREVRATEWVPVSTEGESRGYDDEWLPAETEWSRLNAAR